MYGLRSCVRVVTVLLAAVGLLARATTAAALGTAFTYQGQLQQSATPVNGACDFQFALFDAATPAGPKSATR